ncbi:uncharacterized protein LOC126968186 [Leptidea sinapis]|uniref:uncharacterized protein LOC126968186 n=1 Tax=Leptidea sinapis TaxID=189913 RepID=UPI0021C2F2BD|nr:uncharacterized protein LOC126968186 [Leptidea sinapis]
MSESEKTKKPWTYNDQNDESKNEQKYFHSYQYVNNNTNNNGVSFRRPPYNNSIEDAAPASSNLNLLNYQYPEMNYENVRNLFPLIKPFHTESDVSLSIPDKYKSINEYQKNIQNFFTTATPIVTTNWGNLFKENELGSYKKHIRKPNYFEDNTDVVHIPKKQTYKYENNYDGSAYDWSQYYNNYKPHANLYKYTDWAKDISNKYKTDEDLLDLRNHDVTRPSHPPRYRPIDNDATEDFDYKKLVDKWRKSYLKSKQKEALREYETYASEAKPIHVPIHKPYPIEVPHPVIVPVLQPYPVRVPIPKPVPVPVVRELTVPIEKIVPYPVFKKVPYQIEKPVAVSVEKQVHVPVMKPYPVKVPQVRPLFHHTKSHDERDPDYDEDDDYLPRPENSRRIPTVKKPKIPRKQPRRPSRMSYQDRDQRRRPSRRPTHDSYRETPKEHKRPRRPQEHRRPSRHRDDDDEEYEPRDYLYCKRTGNC